MNYIKDDLLRGYLTLANSLPDLNWLFKDINLNIFSETAIKGILAAKNNEENANFDEIANKYYGDTTE